MLGLSILRTKELKRLRDIDETFNSIIRSKNESIESLKIIIKQLKKKQ
jgi:hypothetical protein